MHPDLAKAADILSIQLRGLDQAAQFSEGLIERYKELIRDSLEEEASPLASGGDIENVDVVLLGSIARREGTPGSDCDYFILQNGASPRTTRRLLQIMEGIRRDLGTPAPGAQAVFGRVVIAANLYESIGLDIDTNVNMTRRILLLTESEPVLSGSTHPKVIDDILSRYCDDYLSPNRPPDAPAKVPRYLLNDLVRFWRTMAVDFGTKRWETGTDDSYLRLAKLRITRKVLFAGPLMSLLLVPRRIAKSSQLQPYLTEALRKPPLAQLASAVDLIGSKSALRDLLTAYDEFILLLYGDERKILKNRAPKDGSRFDELWDRCQCIGNTVQKSLEGLFFDDDALRTNFREYSVF